VARDSLDATLQLCCEAFAPLLEACSRLLALLPQLAQERSLLDALDASLTALLSAVDTAMRAGVSSAGQRGAARDRLAAGMALLSEVAQNLSAGLRAALSTDLSVFFWSAASMSVQASPLDEAIAAAEDCDAFLEEINEYR